MAEFWNSISNISFILLSLHGIYNCYHYGYGISLYLCYSGLLFIGVGSWMFHATLRYEFQLLDELPMLYCACFLVYALYVQCVRVNELCTHADHTFLMHVRLCSQTY